MEGSNATGRGEGNPFTHPPNSNAFSILTCLNGRKTNKTTGAFVFPAIGLEPFGRKALILRDGGAEGIRTPDPHNAIVVLYQLSYDPIQSERNLKSLR